ncbi:unnamed protein product [Notodromas monacha]|uniref:Sushi domain-containing protein n=1 Tax=Notodromas monacha TaxID=399045 RepID=A0A7R9BL38_9CRUS|nr:unnamed protein product [Notodromas monacha]CAG0917203.1 unnamed protein product [Notodromas monacha]
MERQWASVLTLDGVFVTFGCHPHWVADFADECRDAMIKALKHPRVIAAGEFGLDYCVRKTGNNPDKPLQQAVFRDQLQIALDANKPIVIHCREAHEDCLRIMIEMVPEYWKIHRHCVTNSMEEMQEWMDAFPNCYFGFTNFITAPKSRPAHDSVRNIPLERIILETDSPYHFPHVLNNPKPALSHPGMVLHVAAQIACLKGVRDADATWCGFPGQPANGSVVSLVPAYLPQEMVQYQCNPGYILFGSKTRRCAENGTWLGDMPHCESNLATGRSAHQSQTLYDYTANKAVDGDPETCSFTPRSQGMDGNKWWQLDLEALHDISAVGITMTPDTLQEFGIYVINKKASGEIEFKHCADFRGTFRAQKALFKCNAGLGQQGQYIHIKDERMRDEYFGLCEVEVFARQDQVPCGDPEQPLHSSVNRTGFRAVYGCSPGFQIQGQAVRDCLLSGQWTGQAPVCRQGEWCCSSRSLGTGGTNPEVTCPGPPPRVANAVHHLQKQRGNFKNGAGRKVAVYQCLPGFNMHQNGSSSSSSRVVSTCGENGQWTSASSRIACLPASSSSSSASAGGGDGNKEPVWMGHGSQPGHHQQVMINDQLPEWTSSQQADDWASTPSSAPAAAAGPGHHQHTPSHAVTHDALFGVLVSTAAVLLVILVSVLVCWRVYPKLLRERHKSLRRTRSKLILPAGFFSRHLPENETLPSSYYMDPDSSSSSSMMVASQLASHAELSGSNNMIYDVPCGSQQSLEAKYANLRTPLKTFNTTRKLEQTYANAMRADGRLVQVGHGQRTRTRTSVSTSAGGEDTCESSSSAAAAQGSLSKLEQHGRIDVDDDDDGDDENSAVAARAGQGHASGNEYQSLEEVHSSRSQHHDRQQQASMSHSPTAAHVSSDDRVIVYAQLDMTRKAGKGLLTSSSTDLVSSSSDRIFGREDKVVYTNLRPLPPIPAPAPDHHRFIASPAPADDNDNDDAHTGC